MRCLVGIDDTDSYRGFCTTYLAYRIAVDLGYCLTVLPYPRLVRLNPNIPFKTRGNAAVCLKVEVEDPLRAFEALSEKVREFSDTEGGANSAMVMLQDVEKAPQFSQLYQDALTGMVNPARVRRMLREVGARWLELGNGMGVVGASSALAFDERSDHTYELISYRSRDRWGTRRMLDPGSVKEMESRAYPHVYNSYDHQKRKALVAPHGPDPVFAGIRGDLPEGLIDAFHQLQVEEPLEGYMVFVSNQLTDAHLMDEVRWKPFSSGWLEGEVQKVETGRGGHVYVTIKSKGKSRLVAAYEPTGDLRRVARLLSTGDRVRVFGGVRRGTSLHPEVLNLEKLLVLKNGGRDAALRRGTYIPSPRANRHLTKPLARYGRESHGPEPAIDGWLEPRVTGRQVLARSP